MNGRGHIPEEFERLLGGYATGTLSEEEHARLMKAALENQALFDALMEEEALRETLAEPGTKRKLISALEPVVPWWRRPWVWVPSMGAVAVTVLLGVFLVRQQGVFRPAKTVDVAQHRMQSPPPQAAAPPAQDASLETRQQAKPAQRKIEAVDELKQSMEVPAEAKRRDAPAPAPAREAEALEKDKAQLTLGPVKPAANRVAAPVAPEVRDAAPRTRQEAKVTAASVVGQASKPPEEGIQVAVAFQRADGTWRDVDAEGSLPAGRPIRLTATAPRDGFLTIGPKPSIRQMVSAGQGATFTLPAQAAGELVLRMTLADQAAAAEGGGMAFQAADSRLMEKGAAAKRAATGGASNERKKEIADAVAAPVLVKELRLKVVE